MNYTLSGQQTTSLSTLGIDGGQKKVGPLQNFGYFFSSPLQRIQKAQHITDLVVVAVLTSRGCTPALLLSIILNCPMLRLWLLAQVLVPWKIKVTLEALSCHYQQLPVRVFKPKGAQWLSVLFNWVVFPT